MKKLKTTLLTILATVTIAYGQITTTKIPSKIPEVDNLPYDSIQNFLGKNVNKYIGQELYLLGKTENIRKFGYPGFYSDYKKGKFDGGVYKCCDGYNSKYNELNGKYFKVLEIIQHPKAFENESLYGIKSFLKLEERTSKDILYFEYSSKLDYEFPFIVVGFFEKQKALTLGKEYVIIDELLVDSNDIETGKAIIKKTGEIWKCIDLTIDEKYYSLKLVVKNVVGEKITIYYDDVFSKKSRKNVYSKTEADIYKKKFGPVIFKTILQGNVTIGMTKEMCETSWGEPKSINKTITSNKKTEQWVYSNNYLYFENGILKTIQ